MSKQNRHTPGPWRSSEGFIYSEGSDGIYNLIVEMPKKGDEGLDPEGNFFAGNETIFDCEANARLIASAPELLEALIELRDNWETLVGQDLAEGNKDVKKIMHQTDCALARAGSY